MGCHRVDHLTPAGLVTTWHATGADADAAAKALMGAFAWLRVEEA